MVIRMTDSSNKTNNSNSSSNNNNNNNQGLRRTTKMTRTIETGSNKNTKAEFKRLKTILPSIRRKDNVSKLDIILEAIKYIDDLQDQLIDRLSGTHSQREAALLALTEQDMERSRVKLSQMRQNSEEMVAVSSSEDDELIEDVALEHSSDDDAHSHASLEL
jgi:hypothetical protein